MKSYKRLRAALRGAGRTMLVAAAALSLPFLIAGLAMLGIHVLVPLLGVPVSLLLTVPVALLGVYAYIEFLI